jgi:hypothetical protein
VGVIDEPSECIGTVPDATFLVLIAQKSGASLEVIGVVAVQVMLLRDPL